MTNADTAEPKMPPDDFLIVSRATLEKHYAVLKTMSERSASYDMRQLAQMLMRWIEETRGDKTKTELPLRHHA
jgi:hypothetical protein